jgi:hypothetical protein
MAITMNGVRRSRPHTALVVSVSMVVVSIAAVRAIGQLTPNAAAASFVQLTESPCSSIGIWTGDANSTTITDAVADIRFCFRAETAGSMHGIRPSQVVQGTGRFVLEPVNLATHAAIDEECGGCRSRLARERHRTAADNAAEVA